MVGLDGNGRVFGDKNQLKTGGEAGGAIECEAEGGRDD